MGVVKIPLGQDVVNSTSRISTTKHHSSVLLGGSGSTTAPPSICIQ